MAGFSCTQDRNEREERKLHSSDCHSKSHGGEQLQFALGGGLFIGGLNCQPLITEMRGWYSANDRSHGGDGVMRAAENCAMVQNGLQLPDTEESHGRCKAGVQGGVWQHNQPLTVSA